MEHNHLVIDDDIHFTIDPLTRAISHPSPESLIVVKGDHQSERFTFEMPSVVDGHEMVDCTSVEVHYINIDGSNTNNTSCDIYFVDDLKIKDGDSDTVTFTWLVAQSAAIYAGLLTFAIRFVCKDEGGTTIYVWNTAPYEGLTVSDGINNNEAAAEKYYDALEAWYNQINKAKEDSLKDIEDAKNAAIDEIDDQVKLSVDAHAEEMKKYVTADTLSASDILVQETGYSSDKVMSQDVVTREFDSMWSEIETQTTNAVNESRAIADELKESIGKAGSVELTPTATNSNTGLSSYEIESGKKYKVYGKKTDGSWGVYVSLAYMAIRDGVEEQQNKIIDIPANPYSESVTLTVNPVLRSDGNSSCIITVDGNETVYEYASSTCDSIVINYASKVFISNESGEFTVNANGIASIERTGGDMMCNTYTISFDDGSTFDYDVFNGDGITSIERTNRGDYEDTYIIRLKSGKTTTFTVPNAGATGIRKTVTGEAIRVDDVSPASHRVKVNLESRNLIPYTYAGTNSTSYGVTFTENGDGTITANGTATDHANYFCAWSPSLIPIEAGVYTISGCPSGGGSTTYEFVVGWRKLPTDQRQLYYEQGSGVTVEFAEDGYVDAICVVHSGANANGVVFKPMITKGDVVTDYIPYVDPTSADVFACGKNLLKQPYDSRTKQFNGITVTENDDGSFTVNGTATSECIWFLMDGENKYLKGKYTFSGITGGSATTYYAQLVVDGVYGPAIVDTATFDFDGTLTRVGFYIKTGCTLNNATFKLQLEKGDTATEYEPYVGKTYTPNYNGSVSNVTSISPTMTLLSSHEGVNLKMEYLCVPKGESAYDVAVKNGFEGTEAEWLASLKGKDGVSVNAEVTKELGDSETKVISQKTITENLDKLGVSILPTGELTNSSYILASSGTVASVSDSSVTDFIELKPASRVEIKGAYLVGNRGICAYDAGKKRVMTIAENTSDTECVIESVPLNVKYIRITCRLNNAPLVVQANALADNDVYMDNITIDGEFESGYLGNDGQTKYENANYKISPYIAVHPHQEIEIRNVISAGGSSLHCYDANKNAIMSFEGYSYIASGVFTLPFNAHFIRVHAQTGSEGSVAVSYTKRIRHNASTMELVNGWFNDAHCKIDKILNTATKKPIITFIDDDTTSVEGVKRFRDICMELGIRGTYACLTALLDNDTSGELKNTLLEYQKEGFHIAMHAHNEHDLYAVVHVDIVKGNTIAEETLKTLERDFVTCIQKLKSFGFIDTDFWITPGGSVDYVNDDLMRKWGINCYVTCGNDGLAYEGTNPIRGRYGLVRPSIGASDNSGSQTVAQVKTIIDNASVDNGWVIVCTHMCDSAWANETALNRFRELVNYARDKGFEVRTLNDAWRIREPIYKLYEMF